MLRQNWMAPSEKTRWRLPRPLAGAHHCMALSNQIVSDPRAFSAALYAAQLVVLKRPLTPLASHMRAAYQVASAGLCNKAELVLNHMLLRCFDDRKTICLRVRKSCGHVRDLLRLISTYMFLAAGEGTDHPPSGRAVDERDRTERHGQDLHSD